MSTPPQPKHTHILISTPALPALQRFCLSPPPRTWGRGQADIHQPRVRGTHGYSYDLPTHLWIGWVATGWIAVGEIDTISRYVLVFSQGSCLQGFARRYKKKMRNSGNASLVPSSRHLPPPLPSVSGRSREPNLHDYLVDRRCLAGRPPCSAHKLTFNLWGDVWLLGGLREGMNGGPGGGGSG